MQFYEKDSTLIIEGDFEAVSTGLNGGRARVKDLFNKQVPRTFNPPDPGKFVEEAALELGIREPYFGLLTAVNMEYLQVIEDDYLTVFVTAGVSNGSEFRIEKVEKVEKVEKIGTINIILISKEKLSETGLLGAIITATEAKGLALLEKGYTFLGTNTDAVIVAYEKDSEKNSECEEGLEIPYAGSSTDFGKKITKAVMKGVKAGLELRGE
ncbi:Adenosylcobinamide amidohydrolase [Methanosarcina sp. MTP4]|uniref:adenosylcobinamide amidohydrolase n=1 Tax=Methanosarcina sp. MTP4 TaxID=1434100 RepID=UPI00061564A0|nr:adenosylcobinamide amidohydrolase [Methanosarcina sp. MTP4]AKB24611.1 Adenosylcobinamide amidohydrolase [Methanosarcina sp. MTP4]